ncbi:hypothetical protein EE612_055158, partial [Oryza sativa]
GPVVLGLLALAFSTTVLAEN